MVDVSGGTVTLEFPWKGEKIRREVKREYGFKSVVPSQTLALYANPANFAEMRPATFDELWAGTIALGVISLFLAGAGIFLLRVEDDEMPAEFADQFKHAASGSQPIDRSPRHDDDNRVIDMREPPESWQANVFWGLLFGLLLIVPTLFDAEETSSLQKYGLIVAGLAWMGFMGLSAFRNYGRTVHCDDKSIVVSQAFGSKRILLDDVKKVTRMDVGQKLRDFDNIGRSRWGKMQTTKMNIVKYVLYDA